MIPTLYFGSFGISTYWLMVLLGAMSMFICLLYRREKFGLSVMQTVSFNILLTLTGIAGAMMLFTVENIPNGWQFGGTSFFGSVFLVPLLMSFIGNIFRLQGRQSCDLCAPCVALMVGCIRIGCFLNNCCGGNCVEAFGLVFCWPTQIIESIGDFAIAILLLKWEERAFSAGILYPIFMILYSVMRFFIEFLRNTSKDWLFLSHGQWFAIGAFVVGLAWISQKKIREKV